MPLIFATPTVGANIVWIDWGVDCLLQLIPMLQHYRAPLRWRHNEHDGVSNHQPLECLLECLFRRRSNETSEIRVTDRWIPRILSISFRVISLSLGNHTFVTVLWKYWELQHSDFEDLSIWQCKLRSTEVDSYITTVTKLLINNNSYGKHSHVNPCWQSYA